MIENQHMTLDETQKGASNQFLSLLHDMKIIEAIELFMASDFEIVYNGKPRKIMKPTWLRFLKKTVFNKFFSIKQFKIINIENDSTVTQFRIYMICRKFNGNLFFTELNIQNYWNENLITKTIYTLTDY
ncbi:MAG: hypothetical protein JKY02_08660 [Flavobacteriaceae bacterium]|nr:hypothetical protein [Flavobacteriaceae bacterium]